MPFTITRAVVLSLALSMGSPVTAVADPKLSEATRQVESGAKSVGTGVKETAKGIGNTVAESAKTVGDRLEESGKAAEPQARSAWEHARQGAVDFGQSVKGFFTRLFGN